MSGAPAGFVPATFALSFRLGELPLWRKDFRALSLDAHYFDLTSDIAEPAPPVERLGHDVDVIVTRSHPYREPLPALARDGGVLRYVRSRYTRFHTDLSGGFDDYVAKFSAKSRSTLRRKVRRFESAGERGGLRVFRRPEEMDEFLGLARQVSALTYQEKLLDAGIPGDASYREDLVALAARDSVRGYILELAGEPVAYLCCPARDGILLYGYLGYDPRHAELSPGTVLQYLAFASLFAERRFRVFDFTEGQGEHKRFFGTVATPCADICYFKAGPRAYFWVGLHVALDGLSAGVVGVLDRLGVKARIKKLLRRW